MKDASMTMNVWLPSDPQDYTIDEFLPDADSARKEVFYTLGVAGMKFFFCDREELDALCLALHDITLRWNIADNKKAVAQEVNG